MIEHFDVVFSISHPPVTSPPNSRSIATQTSTQAQAGNPLRDADKIPKLPLALSLFSLRVSGGGGATWPFSPWLDLFELYCCISGQRGGRERPQENGDFIGKERAALHHCNRTSTFGSVVVDCHFASSELTSTLGPELQSGMWGPTNIRRKMSHFV